MEGSEISKTFDPLKDDEELSEEILGARIKREISNIIKSYSGWYDPLSELIQNALDSVDQRAKEQKKDYVPSIWITINLKENSVSVTDNGIGFSERQFKNFLKPSLSWKGGPTRGNKGVGATYLAYGFNFLNIGTKVDGYNFCGTLKHGREWVEDENNIIPRPEVTESEPIDDTFNSMDKGSTFTLKFEGEYIFPADLTWIGATNAKQWDAILRINTPLGGIYLDHEPTKTICYLKVINGSDKESNEIIEECEYVYPHKVISTCRNFKDVLEIQDQITQKGKYAGRLPSHLTNLNGLYAHWDYNEILSKESSLRPNLREEQKQLLKKHKVNVYGFLCYSTGLWDYYNDDILEIRKKARILKGGLQIASNSMPQGKLLVIPLKASIGLQEQAHVIVHFDSAEPDMGRKGFKHEIQELAEAISISVIGILKNWRHLMRKQTGPASILEDSKLSNWIEIQKEHEKNHPLKITNKEFFQPINELPITSEPLFEQDVVALFHQLLAGGVIRGIKIMATDEHKQYDGIYRVWLKKPLENHIFDKNDNPLGIDKSRTLEEFESQPYVLEYKFNLDFLIRDIENEDKNENRIDLAIVWNVGTLWKKRYQINSLLLFENVHNRIFHGATHAVLNSDTGQPTFYLIALKELIDFINNPDSAQDYQRKTYAEV